MSNRIREWRKKRKMTQRELARLADTSESYISRLEKGTNEPTLAIARRLADALKCTLDDLFGSNNKRTL